MISEEKIVSLRKDVASRMDEWRYRHTLGVEKEMRYLASVYLPEKAEKAAVAGLLHDITKALSKEEQLDYCRKNGIELSLEEEEAYRVLHAKTGAHLVTVQYPAFADSEVIRAIACHTAADTAMTLFDVLLYVADFIEENRTFPECVALRQAFYQGIQNSSIDKIALLYEIFIKALDASLMELLREGRTVFLKTVAARNEAIQLLNNLKGKK